MGDGSRFVLCCELFRDYAGVLQCTTVSLFCRQATRKYLFLLYGIENVAAAINIANILT